MADKSLLSWQEYMKKVATMKFSFWNEKVYVSPGTIVPKKIKEKCETLVTKSDWKIQTVGKSVIIQKLKYLDKYEIRVWLTWYGQKYTYNNFAYQDSLYFDKNWNYLGSSSTIKEDTYKNLFTS